MAKIFPGLNDAQSKLEELYTQARSSERLQVESIFSPGEWTTIDVAFFVRHTVPMSARWVGIETTEQMDEQYLAMKKGKLIRSKLGTMQFRIVNVEEM